MRVKSEVGSPHNACISTSVVRNGWKKAQAGRVGRVRNGRERRSDGSRSVYRAVSCESEQEECVRAVLRRQTFELQRPMYVRCKPHVPLLNLNRTHAPSEGDGRTIHDNIYKYIYIYTDSAGVDRTRRGSLRLAPMKHWSNNIKKENGISRADSCF